MINQDEFLKTEVAVASHVAKGLAFEETLSVKERNIATIVITRADGTVEAPIYGWNARVNAGALGQAVLMGSAAGTPFAYLALSSASLTIALGDTTLASEITTNGLVRVLATYGSYVAPTTLGGSASFQLTKTFTATGTSTVNSCALFNAVTVGTMFSEINLTSAATLNSGDTLALSYTINI
jgi:hypothetical protein